MALCEIYNFAFEMMFKTGIIWIGADTVFLLPLLNHSPLHAKVLLR